MPQAVQEVDGGYAMELSPSNDEGRGKGWGHEASAKAVQARLDRLGATSPQVRGLAATYF